MIINFSFSVGLLYLDIMPLSVDLTNWIFVFVVEMMNIDDGSEDEDDDVIVMDYDIVPFGMIKVKLFDWPV